MRDRLKAVVLNDYDRRLTVVLKISGVSLSVGNFTKKWLEGRVGTCSANGVLISAIVYIFCGRWSRPKRIWIFVALVCIRVGGHITSTSWTCIRLEWRSWWHLRRWRRRRELFWSVRTVKHTTGGSEVASTALHWHAIGQVTQKTKCACWLRTLKGARAWVTDHWWQRRRAWTGADHISFHGYLIVDGWQ